MKLLSSYLVRRVTVSYNCDDLSLCCSSRQGQIQDNGATVKRRRSPEPTAAPPAKRKIVVEEAVLNREDISDDEEEMSV